MQSQEPALLARSLFKIREAVSLFAASRHPASAYCVLQSGSRVISQRPPAIAVAARMSSELLRPACVRGRDCFLEAWRDPAHGEHKSVRGYAPTTRAAAR